MASVNEVYRYSFSTFRSVVCHKLMWHGDIDFIRNCMERDEIRTFYDCTGIRRLFAFWLWLIIYQETLDLEDFKQ